MAVEDVQEIQRSAVAENTDLKIEFILHFERRIEWILQKMERFCRRIDIKGDNYEIINLRKRLGTDGLPIRKIMDILYIIDEQSEEKTRLEGIKVEVTKVKFDIEQFTIIMNNKIEKIEKINLMSFNEDKITKLLNQSDIKIDSVIKSLRANMESQMESQMEQMKLQYCILMEMQKKENVQKEQVIRELYEFRKLIDTDRDKEVYRLLKDTVSSLKSLQEQNKRLAEHISYLDQKAHQFEREKCSVM